jgi:CHAT domain-containing protein
MMHFKLAQRALRQGQWTKAEIECERALTLAETFRATSATAAERLKHLTAFQQYNEFYVDLLMQRQPSEFETDWVERAWEVNERAHWHRWLQTLQGIAGKSPSMSPVPAFKDVLEKVQKRLRDSQSTLLEYALGQFHSYVWLLDGKEVTAYELPARAILEKQAQLVYRQLSQPVPNQFQTDCQALDKLSELLLRPVSRVLQEKTRRLFVVADGDLQRVPFGVLARNSACQADDPVLATHEVSHLPAALVLLDGFAEHKALSAGVAVVADPVFGKHDERMNAPDRLPALSSLLPLAWQVTRLQTHTQENTVTAATLMPRLPFARYEAENVTRWFAPLTALCATGFAANRRLALDGRLAHYPIIHFATHGFNDGLHPEQSGLVLSQVSERGDAQEGLLRLRDICRLELAAELIVLSACESGIAKTANRFIPSASVAEGFLFAGAHRVISTLWPINDAATAELMKHFYEGLLGEQHLTPALALRRAQLLLARDARWQHPYYWAAFVLQGEH